MKYYMSRGVRKRLRRAIREDMKTTDDVPGLEALLEVVDNTPTGRLVPDEWKPGDGQPSTDAELVAEAVVHYGVMETLP